MSGQFVQALFLDMLRAKAKFDGIVTLPEVDASVVQQVVRWIDSLVEATTALQAEKIQAEAALLLIQQLVDDPDSIRVVDSDPRAPFFRKIQLMALRARRAT